MRGEKLIIPLLLVYALIVVAANIAIVYIILHFVMKYW